MISDRKYLAGTVSVVRWDLLSNASSTCLLLLVRFHVQDGTDEMIEARIRSLVEQPSRQRRGHDRNEPPRNSYYAQCRPTGPLEYEHKEGADKVSDL